MKEPAFQVGSFEILGMFKKFQINIKVNTTEKIPCNNLP